MKESILRETIRKEIRKSLKEVDATTGVERETSKIDKNAGVKMLKRALSQGSPRQQAAGLIKVIDAISGGSTAVKNALMQMLRTKDSLGTEPVAEPVAEDAYTAGVHDGSAGTSLEEGLFDFLKKKKKEAPKAKVKGNEPIGVDYDGNYIYAESVNEADVNPALARKGERLDKTQAMKMLKTALGSKAATQQTDFVLDLINGLGLKDAAKQRLKMKIRKELK